jgi:hypothetical protein
MRPTVTRRVPRWALSLLAGIVLGSALALAPSPAAAAPGATVSRYVSLISESYHYQMGCNAALTKVSGVTVLIYGKPVVVRGRYGASLYGGPDATIAQIGAAVKAFGRGYYRCSLRSRPHTTFVNLVIATTNCCGRGQVRYEHGRAWARMVNDVGAWLRARGYAGKVRVRGGSDMEPSYNSRWRTWQWWLGYHSVNRYYLYNVGSADGCPQTGDGRANGYCNNGWRQSDLFGLSWHGDAVPLPQIYLNSGAQARQWKQIKLYGIVSEGRSMTLMGSLTQSRACQQSADLCRTTDNRPSVGWSQLYNVLASHPRTRQPVSYSTDISWR